MKFGVANPSSIELYREQTAASTPLSLRRKRCSCRTVVTAKQLAQYGACAPCVRLAATNDARKEAA